MTQSERPHHAKGWMLIEEYAKGLDGDRRSEFCASMRNYEGAFTSGLIDEGTFVSALKRAFDNVGRTLARPSDGASDQGVKDGGE